MNRVLSEIASTFHKDKCCDKDDKFKNLPGGGVIIWIVLAVVLCLCSSKGNFGGFIGNPCCKPKKDCGPTGGSTGILAAVFLLLLFAGNGNGNILGVGSSPGNVNTNLINVGTQDDCCEDEYYEESCCSQKC